MTRRVETKSVMARVSKSTIQKFQNLLGAENVEQDEELRTLLSQDLYEAGAVPVSYTHLTLPTTPYV